MHVLTQVISNTKYSYKKRKCPVAQSVVAAIGGLADAVEELREDNAQVED